MFDFRNGLVWSTDSLTLLVCMSCLKEGLYCSKLSCRVTIRGRVSQDFTSGRSKCLRGERLGKKWTLSNTLSKGCPQHGGGQFTAGLVTNSILSCLLFCKHEARGHCKNFYKHTNKVCTHCVLGRPRLRWHTWQCHCISFLLEATHKRRWGPLKRSISAQKGLQGFETGMRKLLEGTKLNNSSSMWGVFDLPSGQILEILEQKKLVTRPEE